VLGHDASRLGGALVKEEMPASVERTQYGRGNLAREDARVLERRDHVFRPVQHQRRDGDGCQLFE
jgi:hypothetical protein